MSSKKKRYSIKHSGFFRPGASRNARNVGKTIDLDLTERKKTEIINLIRDLKSSKVIADFRKTRNSKRALYVNVDIVKKNINKRDIKLQFIIWTDNKPKPDNWTSANSAGFFLRIYEDIKEKVLDYLEGIQTGLTTEYLGIAVLERLQSAPLPERKFKYFRPATPDEDKYEGKDVVVVIIHDGRDIEAPLQFKSSKKELMRHREDFEDVSGWFRVFTGNVEKDMGIIEEKTVKIFEAYKRGETIFI